MEAMREEQVEELESKREILIDAIEKGDHVNWLGDEFLLVQRVLKADAALLAEREAAAEKIAKLEAIVAEVPAQIRGMLDAGISYGLMKTPFDDAWKKVDEDDPFLRKVRAASAPQPTAGEGVGRE